MEDFDIKKIVDSNKLELGYALISEEQGPSELIKYAKLAEESGFNFATVSDHYHPWIKQQGQSPFVWSTIGAISQVTNNLKVGTAVTCPTIRMHPAIIAQAAATSATLLPNRFFLGVGTGENLNEHIIGVRWPNHEIRREMLKEGVEIIRELWKGKRTNYLGKYYTVENAKIYTLPPQNPPIIIAVEGKEIAKLASTIGDGMISTTLNPELIDLFNIDKVNDNRPLYCQITVCYAPSEREAREIVFKQWPINALPSDLNWEIQSTELFEKAVSVVSEEQATANIACGPDLAKQAQAINEAVEAGFRKISIHNIGPFQEEFFKFYKNQVIPNLMFLKEEIC